MNSGNDGNDLLKPAVRIAWSGGAQAPTSTTNGGTSAPGSNSNMNDQGADEVDGETRVINFNSTQALTDFFLSEQRDQSSIRRIRGFPDPPPSPKSIGERIARFFGVDEAQAELKSWRIRHALALQGYLKQEYVPKLPDYEADEVDTVCFRVPERTVQGGARIRVDPNHSTGRSFQYRELCRPNPPAKDHVWVMAWLGILSLFRWLNEWRSNRAAEFKELGHGIKENFQELVADIKASKDSADGTGKQAEAEDSEEMTFFDDRTLPMKPLADGGGEDMVDGPSSVGASRRARKPMTQIYEERRLEREAADHHGRRGLKGLDRASDKPPRHSDRSKPKFGLISFLLGHRYKSGTIDAGTEARLSDVYSYRPYFTYWASAVHILVMIISLASYGFAPGGLGNKLETATVASVSGGSQSVEREVERNFWGGPTFTDLIHIGAKYGPCMRQDKRIFDEIKRERVIERNLTACCLRTDSAICYQSTAAQCPTSFFRWLKWTGSPTISFGFNGTGAGNESRVFDVPSYTTPSLVQAADPSTCVANGTRCYRTSGSVCGQDPISCQQPASRSPREWPDDISRWPVCSEVDPVLNVTTTSCEVTGRPCCIGKQGVCTIATKEHCDYVHGFYHPEKRLCSEVNCLEDICGLTRFLNSDSPDQFYRLWTSLCLHVGILHLALTLIVHMTIGRHIEKLIGWFRMGMIYVLSGIGGNLVSAVFVPYQAEVGPGAALFGLLATLVVDTIKERQLLEHPWRELNKLFGIILFSFFLGLLPYIDNFAHIGGFVMGLLSAVLFVPYIGQSLLGVNSDGRRLLLEERRWNRIYHIGSMVVAFLAIVTYFLLFFLLFYNVQPICTNCSYVNCIPLTDTLCRDLSVDVKNRNCYVCNT